MLRPQLCREREPTLPVLESEEGNVAKIFSRDEYYQALRGQLESISRRGMTAEAYREAVHAAMGKRVTAGHKTVDYCPSFHGDKRSSRRRNAYRHLEAYAGQFY
jgi:hypothetical protein